MQMGIINAKCFDFGVNKSRVTSRFSLLLPVLFLAFSLELWALDSLPGGQVRENSENALNRLIEISAQLSTLNERLQSELQDSRRSSRELQNMLETSRKELDGLRLELGVLRQELEILRFSSTELVTRAENSQEELAALKTALRKADSSLMSLELSFALYQEASERKISALSRERALWKWACVAAGALAAGFGAALLAGR